MAELSPEELQRWAELQRQVDGESTALVAAMDDQEIEIRWQRMLPQCCVDGAPKGGLTMADKRLILAGALAIDVYQEFKAGLRTVPQ